METFTYLLKASSILAMGYMLYFLFLSRITFFAANRIYLLGITCIAVFLPLLHVELNQTVVHVPFHQRFTVYKKIFLETSESAAQNGLPNFNWITIAQFIYLIICALLFCKLVYTVVKLLSKTRQQYVPAGRFKIIQGAKEGNSSFFNYIFIRPGMKPHEEKQVLAHEQQHVLLLHSFDKLFLEILKVFFWFNPFIYLISSALSDVHEFQVDESITTNHDPKKYASLILSLSVQKSDIKFVNSFSARRLKNRFRVMFAPRSAELNKFRYLLVLPFIAIFVYFFSITTVYGYKRSRVFTLILDAGHGGIQIGAVTANGIGEKDLTLALAKEIAGIAEKNGINVILTRAKDETVDLPSRLKNKGDLFLSLHYNSVGAGRSDNHGSEILINNTLKQSTAFAEYLQNGLNALPGLNPDRQVKIYQTGHSSYLLRENKSPAAILEVAYLSNPNDVSYAANPANRRLLAQKVIESIENYRHHLE